MQPISRVVIGLAVLLSASALLHAVQVEIVPPERAAEIDAKCWFNAQPVRLHDPPKLILLEFWSVRSGESREFVDVLTGVHRAYRDGRLLIVALTEDKCEDTRRFIDRKKLPYKVGAESRSGDEYKIKELPAVILIDPKESQIVARWTGREVKVKAIASAIQDFLGPPPGVASPGALPPVEMELVHSRIAEANDQLATITSAMLAADGEIGPEALSALDRFYEQNLSEHPDQDNAVTRAQAYARGAMMGPDLDVGYGGLMSRGRLSDAGKVAIRDRVLEIAEKDPSPSVRLYAAAALRKFIGQPGDAVALEALRGMLARETAPIVRATIDHALEELDPSRASAKRQERATRPIVPQIRRMLNESPDPASSVWADAYAYRQTVSKRTTDQLIEDYRAFPDPPGDEVGMQNASLKRDGAMGELENRILQGEVRDVRAVKDHLAQVLSEEPDPFIRKHVIWSGLRPIAERGGRGMRSDIVDLLEKRLPVEPDRYVKATIETAITELKGK